MCVMGIGVCQCVIFIGVWLCVMFIGVCLCVLFMCVSVYTVVCVSVCTMSVCDVYR